MGETKGSFSDLSRLVFLFLIRPHRLLSRCKCEINPPCQVSCFISKFPLGYAAVAVWSLDDRIRRAAENLLGWSSSRRTSWVSDVKSERSSFHASLRCRYYSKTPATSPRPAPPPPPRPAGPRPRAQPCYLGGAKKACAIAPEPLNIYSELQALLSRSNRLDSNLAAESFTSRRWWWGGKREEETEEGIKRH